MPARPFGRAIEETGVPGGNRPVVQEAAQVRRQRGGRLAALTRLARCCRVHDGFQIPGNRWIELAQPGWALFGHQADQRTRSDSLNAGCKASNSYRVNPNA